MDTQFQIMLKEAIQAFRDGNFELAHSSLIENLRVNITGADTIFNLGVAYAEANKFDEALAIFYCLRPYKNADMRIPYNIGLIHSLQGKHGLALDAYDIALKIQPNDVDTLINKGANCNQIKNYALAIETLDYAILLDSNRHEAYSNMGITLHELKRFDEAIAHYDKALSLKPDYHEAWTNMGITLHELKRFDEAIAHFDKALSLKPDYHEATWNKSLSLLLQGDFEKGLSLYESRWWSERVGEIVGKRLFDEPTWLGVESLQGKTILIYGEQGLGDFIQFCRYVKLVSDLGAKVIL